MRKAAIFAPFWGQAGHVGNNRVNRFIRWLSKEGFTIVLVRAGSVTCLHPTPWGVELTVRDPLGVYRDAARNGAAAQARRPNNVRRALANWLFNPDPGILWARRAACNQLVAEHVRGASFVLSSSPPESAHLAAAAIAKKLARKLIVDLRDGWLDEPLKPLLRVSKLQRWREGRLEKAILSRADRILVTSPVWKVLLENRLPFVRGKTTVLFNAYPSEGSLKIDRINKPTTEGLLKLVHAGRFTGSSLSRVPSKLLEPLLLGIAGKQTQGVVTLLGSLEARDIEEIKRWEQRYALEGWKIEMKDALPRDEMMELLSQADGLLLLSASHAAIPSKLFEYIPVGKPIFATTPKSSAVSNIGELIDQIYLTDYRKPDQFVATTFISACEATDMNYEIPSQFREESLSGIFLREVIAD